MKLNAGLVFDRMAEHYDIRYDISSDRDRIVGRPIFYCEGMGQSDHIRVLSSPDAIPEELEDGVYIFAGPVKLPALNRNIELMHITESVSAAELFNRLQAIFDFYDAWESEMTEIVESNRGYGALLECATNYLDCPVSIVDVDFMIIAFSDNRGGNFRDEVHRDKVSPDVMSELLADPEYTKGLNSSDVFEFSVGGELFFSYNFKRDGKYLGRVTLYYTAGISKNACRYLFRFLAIKIDSALNRFGSFLLHKQLISSVRSILSESLEHTPVERQYAENKLAEIGWSYSDEYLLIRLQPEFRHEWQMHAAYLIPLIEQQWSGVCAVEKGDYIVILVNLTVFHLRSDKDFYQQLAFFLRDSLMLAGISRQFRGLNQLISCYRQAELSIALGREKKPMSWYYRFDDVALDCWIRYGVMSFTPEQICSRILLDLLAYDLENGTEHYKTLRTFFNRRFSFTHSAEELYIHRTTLIKRIERITELTKIDLDDKTQRLYLELSFHYLDMTHHQ